MSVKQPDRLKLAHLPTPIIKLERLSKRVGRNIWLWRDDLTDFLGSGNKLRKLEFLAADAVAQGATRLISCGGPQSNHARATAAVARRLGLAVTLVVREPSQGFDDAATPSGNLLLDQILGADFRFVAYGDYVAAGKTYDRFLELERETSLASGERPYVIAEGGSCPIGCFGYIHAIQEMLTTWRQVGPGTEAPDQLFLALGSGGTLAGVHLGYELCGLSPTAVHAVNVCDSAAYFQSRVSALLTQTAEQFHLPWQSRSLNIHDGHFGAGYALTSTDDLRFYGELARLEGVLLDPVYTGKAFQGMLRELAAGGRDFGQNILFLHSGGLFATFAFAGEYRGALANQKK